MAQLQNLPATSSQGTRKVTQFKDHSKVDQVRKSNLIAAKSVADAVRTSLGPRGMDKMIQTAEGAVIITNDGATILKHMSVIHPAAKMLVDLSAAQDVEAGDGTTSVVVLCGALLIEAEKLLAKGIHPTIIAESFSQAAADAVKHLVSVAKPVDLKDRDTLIKAASTSLSSKVVSQYSSLLAPLSVDAVLKVVHDDNFVDLRDVKTVKKVGGTMEDTHLVEGVVLNQRIIKNAGGPVRVEKAKIGLIQFQLSPPKPDMDNNIVVNDYRQMDKILKEERAYLLNLCKIIKKSGCNVLLVQKSILRDAVTDLSLHFLSKLKIMVITDVEREEVDWLCRSLGCRPIADIDAFTEDKLATAEVVTEVESAGAKYVAVHGVKSPNTRKTASIVVHGANSLVVDEAERSIHDAMCVIRCLVKKGFLIAGGGAPEMEVSNKLLELSKTFTGLKGHCYESFSTAVQVIPTTLAENAGLAPLKIVSQLKKLHKKSNTGSGINVKRGTVEDMWSEDVVQPLLVSTSELELAADTVRMIMKIDDIVQAR